MKIYLEKFGYSYCTREAHTDDEWDRGDTSTDWSFGDISLTRPNNSDFDSIEVGKEFNINSDIFAVVVVWSSGDSFGHDAREHAEIFAVYDNSKDAEEAKRLIESHNSGELKLPNNFNHIYIPWIGYFENLDYVEIIKGVLKE